MGRHSRRFRSLFLEQLEDRFLLSSAAGFTERSAPLPSGEGTGVHRQTNIAHATAAAGNHNPNGGPSDVEDESPALEAHEAQDTDDSPPASPPPSTVRPPVTLTIDRTGGRNDQDRKSTRLNSSHLG